MTNQSPKISVIVPVYNVEKYLPRCIDSILAQTFTDFELLLIDDGSTDNSGEICDEYAKNDRRIRVFHKENGGVSSARNTGLINAKGEWVCFVDSDDDICINYLEVYVSLLKHKEADFYIVGCNIISNNRRTKRTFHDQYFSKESIHKFVMYIRYYNIFGVPWNKLFSMKIIKDQNISFDESLDSYEDEVFVLEYLVYTSSVMASSQCTYNYYVREQLSLSKKYIEIDKHIYIAQRLYELGLKLSSDDIYIQHLRKMYSHHMSECITRLYGRYGHYCRQERLKIISKVLKTAKEHNVIKILYSQLNSLKIIGHNAYMIDVNGTLLYLYRSLRHLIKHIV